MIPKRAAEVFDRLVEEYYNDQLEVGSLNSRHMDTPDAAYTKGLYAGYLEAMKSAEKLVEAIKEINRGNYPYCDCLYISREALEQFKKETS